MQHARCMAVLCAALMLTLNRPVVAQDPLNWDLKQNTPDSLCVRDHEVTYFDIVINEPSWIQLLLWDAENSKVIATLMNVGVGGRGTGRVEWEGVLDDGSIISEGKYPYTLVATDLMFTTPLFVAKKYATVLCATPVTPVDWRAVKELYR